MGADGAIHIARRADFDAACPGIKPEYLRLYTGVVLGVEAIWGYQGTNLDGANYLLPRWHAFPGEDPDDQVRQVWDRETQAMYPTTPELRERIFAAAEWFDRNAETHEVWT